MFILIKYVTKYVNLEEKKYILMKIKIKQTYGNLNAPDLKLSDHPNLTVSDLTVLNRSTRSDPVTSGLIHVKSWQTDILAVMVRYPQEPLSPAGCPPPEPSFILVDSDRSSAGDSGPWG